MVGDGYVCANRDRGPQRESASRPLQRIPSNPITPAFRAALDPARAESIVDATAGQAHHQADGVRHEADGDTHGWLQVDPQFADMLNPGNTSDEGGNLVFEIVCHYTVTQPDAQSACSGFADHTTIPPVGTHVAITGTFVREKNHKKWNEIHPVSRIEVQ